MNIEQHGQRILEAMRAFVAKAEAAMSARMQAIENSLGRTSQLVAELKLAKGDKGEPGAKGDKGDGVTIDDVRALVDAAVGALPPAPKGDKGDPGAPGESIKGEKGDRGEKGDGVPVEQVRALVREVAAALPAPTPGAPGAAGKDADPELIRTMVQAAVQALPKPADGKSVKIEDLAPMVQDAVGQAVVALPKAKDGAPGADADPALVRRLIDEAVGRIPKAKDGASVTAADVRPLVADEVGKAVAALPKPKDGSSVPPERVQAMVEDQVGKAMRGVRNGADGQPGRDAAELDILPSIDEAKAYRRGTWASYSGGLIRAARNTEPVKNGDLVSAGWVVMVEGVAAIVVTQEADPREISVAAMLTSGTKMVSQFKIPALLERGVWREGAYDKGDGVTWDGSYWIAQDKTTDKPGTSPAWRLAVKRGRDGKDLKDAPAAPRPVVRTR